MAKRLKHNIIDLIKKDKELRRKLEDVEDKSPHRMYKWILINYPGLCHISYLEVISQMTGIAMDDLYEEVES